jgi:hypothetical protein
MIETRMRAPLTVTTAQMPGDMIVTIHLAPGAPLGQIEVDISRELDHRSYVAFLARLSGHIAQYTREYAWAAREATL